VRVPQARPLQETVPVVEMRPVGEIQVPRGRAAPQALVVRALMRARLPALPVVRAMRVLAAAE